MSFELVTVPCLEDNYAYILHHTETGATVVVDVPAAQPLHDALKSRGWTLSEVWLTHHHWDHVDGLADLLALHPARVLGAAADAHRLPALDVAVADGDVHLFAGEDVQVMDVSGHTVGHIALYVPQAGVVFTADSLMALGCGRLFEGTPDQMWQSLSKLSALPPETIVASGHEYTQSNAKFAQTVDPDNPDLISRIKAIDAARAKGQPTVPSTLATEQATNPFLRPHDPDIRSHLGLASASDAEVFTEIRRRKDNF